MVMKWKSFVLLLLLGIAMNKLVLNAHIQLESFRDIDDLNELDELMKRAYFYNKRAKPDRLLKFSVLREKSDKMIQDFRANINGVVFSGVFSNGAVLQRGPQLSAVYGASDTGNAKITVVLTDNDSNKQYKMDTISATASDPNGEIGDWKVILPQAFPNGGNYTLTAQCSGCKSNASDTLYNITFGDVYYCSGQSNMELEMLATFRRNYSYDRIRDGYYKNIRYFWMYEIDTSNITYVVPLNGNPQYQWVQQPNNNSLSKFSSTCWYFAQSLYDNYSVTDINIGIINTAVGGSMIEQWIQNQTVQLQCKGSLCPDTRCGGLYNGLVASFLNMTIKAALWYQGENNVYETTTNIVNSGYGCMEPFMLNQWRSQWSITPGTTDKLFPFGLVTLAGGTDEGHRDQMGAFRLSQSANYNYAPNMQLENTFIALGHDLGDPWSSQCWYLRPCTCCGYDVPYNWNATEYYMGSIHPRCKIEIGQRLARAGYDILYPGGVGTKQMHTGPLISGCTVDYDNKHEIIINFNTTFLMGNKVVVEAPYFWYNTSILDTIENWSAMEVNIAKGNQWIFVNISQGQNGNDVIVDISEIYAKNQTIKGIRYAWSTYPCCGTLNIEYNPCPPNSCPIKAYDPAFGNDTLPGVPFLANIINKTCVCIAPETC